MTTEIAIMNKSAVALAADSAVTITVRGPEGKNYKVLNTANKLFALSKYAPVGLMVYGNASLQGIPWESIVKIYRKTLADTEFPSLEGYCKNFFDFLDNFEVGEQLEEQYVAQHAMGLFQGLRNELDEWVKVETCACKPITEKQLCDQLRKQVKIRYDKFIKIGKGSVLSQSKRISLKKKYQKLITDISSNVFEKIPLTPQVHSQLRTIAINAASVGPKNQSGIVIAGFGSKDLYPHCRNYDVAAVFAGRTIKREGQQHQSITPHNSASIIPFAQSDEVHTFMQGIGPVLLKFLSKTFYEIMASGLPAKLRDEIGNKIGLSDDKKNDVHKIAKDMCKGACDYAFQQLKQQQQNNYIQPVVTATEFLNKGELAAMAETLVNLVSFRKQVTMETETVGGPIDVAVITKGDGFVWIKRKLYFKPELNHHFFSNYHRKDIKHEIK